MKVLLILLAVSWCAVHQTFAQSTAVSSTVAVSQVIGLTGAQPTPYPGNKIVHVSPGSDTLTDAVNANEANTTYVLSAGTYTLHHRGDNPPFLVANNMQFFGAGGNDRTIIQTTWSDEWAVFESAGNPVSGIQIWGLTIDEGGNRSKGVDGYTNWYHCLVQNCHFRNYAASVRGRECFPIAIEGDATGTVVDNCRFSPATSGNVDGTTVIGFVHGGTIANCTFDTPTDSGTLYYHCTGGAALVTGCKFVAPNDIAIGAFYYYEAGSGGGGDDSASTYTIENNDLALNGMWSVANDNTHKNAKLGHFVIENNTVSGGQCFRLSNVDGYPSTPAVQSVTIKDNMFSRVTVVDTTDAPSGAIGRLLITPNL